jgi:hypothetical protein
MQIIISGSSRTKLTQSCRETAKDHFVSNFKSLTEYGKLTGGMA